MLVYAATTRSSTSRGTIELTSYLAVNAPVLANCAQQAENRPTFTRKEGSVLAIAESLLHTLLTT